MTTTLVAVFQWRLEKQKWRLSLYDKRFETYRAVMEFVSLMVHQAKCTHADEIAFLQKASQNRFLFEADIQAYIELIYKQSVEKNHLQQALANSRGDSRLDHRKTLAEQSHALSLWFGDQFKVAEAKFGRYISITER